MEKQIPKYQLYKICILRIITEQHAKIKITTIKVWNGYDYFGCLEKILIVKGKIKFVGAEKYL